MNASVIDQVVIAVYLIGITAFAIWIGFRRNASTDHYFLANKSLGWFTVGPAVFTSNISTIHLVGLAAGGAKDGMVIGNFEWMACFTLILLALLFAPFYINSGVRTLPEFMERRYCPSARTFLAFIGLAGALLIHIGISLFAAAKVFESFLGIQMITTIIVLSLFTVTYTALGGLKAVVMTENIQVCLLLGGATLVTVLGLRALPGVGVHDVAEFKAAVAPEWVHVADVYQRGDARIYVNGVLDSASKGQGTPLNMRSPARLWLGGWYDHYNFVGDLDEVRVSKVARSADWIRLQCENQKPMQTLVGPVVEPGSSFAVSPERLRVVESGSATVTAQAGGAQKWYWILQRNGRESVVGVDRLTFRFEAGRVTGDEIATLRFKAVQADGVNTKAIPIRIQEAIPDPMLTLEAPANWDGRETIEVMPVISNQAAMQAKGVGELNYTWNASGLATIREVTPDKLILRRAQNSGQLSVALALSNGGTATTQTTKIMVREPKQDAWVQRSPSGDEKPEDNQFFPRDDQNEGTLHCNGTLA
jgi:hypothetical protein